MSLDGSYDMILLPPSRDNDNGGRQPTHWQRNRRRLPHVAEEQHSGLSRRLPRRRRRRQGNQGQAGGGTSSAVERVNGAGAPTGDTSSVDLASETKTSAVSPQHANSKRRDDASTLAKDLLGVTLVPEMTVQSAPDATSSPPVDQECRRFETGGFLDRRVNCRRVPQPRWVGARRSAKGGRQPEGDERERWKSRGLRVCPVPRSGSLAVGGYKRPRGRERAASRERLSRPSPCGQPSVIGPWSFLL
jgi:hypothetical protein